MSIKIECHNECDAKSSQDVLLATPEQPKTALKGRTIEVCSLLIFTAIQIFRPIIARIAHKQAEKHGVTFLGSVIVIATELVKTLICCVMISINQRSVKKLFVVIYQSFTVNKYETLKICLPALLFVVQNNLFYFAIQRIDATLFSVAFQLQLLTTALLMMIILDRRFSCLQWLALIMSLVGVVTVQIGGGDFNNHASKKTANLGMSDQIAGLTAVLIMCFTTAFGCVYLETVLKKSKADIFLQNIRLSLISIPMAAATIFSDYETIKKHGIFTGWNNYVWAIVLLNSFAAIVVSSVIRYADNIKKSFCKALALGATAFLSIYLGDSKFSFHLLYGVTLVVISAILYSLSSSKKPKKEAPLLNLDKSA